MDIDTFCSTCLAGFIFIDYLANKMALAQGEGNDGPPAFYRRFDLNGIVVADVSNPFSPGYAFN